MTVGRQNAKALLGAIVGFAATPKSPQPAPQDKPIKLGTIDPTYRGFGPARVTFDGEISMSAKYYVNTAGPVAPSSRVWLAPVGKTYVIAGIIPSATAPGFMAQVPVPLGTGWALYSDLNQDAGEYGDSMTAVDTSKVGTLFASMTSTGIVSLMGLAAKSTAGTAGEIIAGPLPANMRPARTQVFAVIIMGGAFGWVYITADGNIHLGASFATSLQYVGIDTIRFRASSAGLALQTFTLSGTLTDWAASIGAGDPATAKTHGYTVDADGVVLFEGLISGTTATATNMASIPALSQSATDIFVACRSGTFCEIRFGGTAGTGVAGGFLVNETALAGNWLSLSNIVIAPNPVTFTWGLARLGHPTGSVYGAGYMAPSVARTPDGLVLLRGLAGVATSGSEVVFLPPLYRPRYTGLVLCSGAGGVGGWSTGLDLANTYAQRSSIQFVVGSGVYASLAGLCWPAYS